MTEDRIDIINHSGADDLVTENYPQWLKDRLEWFQDLKFGLMIHWGIYSQWGCIESWPLVEEDTWARPDDLPAWVERGKDLARFRHDYWELNRTFNPTKFDPEPWVDAAEYAGMKYVAFTTKHHDGFCMWDTKTTDYKITAPDCPFHTNPKADVVRAVFDAFRARDFAISCYFSKSDWKSPYYWDPDRPAPDRNPNYDTAMESERWEKFADFAYSQMQELMTDYGHVDALWLDGGQVRPPSQDIHMAKVAEMARALQPGLIIVDRTVGGEFENILTPEQEIPDVPLGHTWESCLTVGDSWSFKPNDTYKSARTLIHMLIDIVAKDGNFLLNVGPTPEGIIPPEQLARLREIGDWMQVNKESIYSTRAVAPYKEGNVCFTKKGDTVYGLVMAEEGESRPAVKVTLRALVPQVGSVVTMLGVDKPLDWRMTSGGAEIDLPGSLPCEHAWVLKFSPAG